MLFAVETTRSGLKGAYVPFYMGAIKAILPSLTLRHPEMYLQIIGKVNDSERR